ncbi:MAG: GNAT family N-acetyltransferase [Candidatus Bipolaricaulaceae bacterium]
MPPAVVLAGLDHSLWCTVAELTGRAVGMARLVGDGAIYAYLQDVIVLPEMQGRGIGRQMVMAALAWLQANFPPEGTVGLMAAPGAAGFYRHLGFRRRPRRAPGMELESGPPPGG